MLPRTTSSSHPVWNPALLRLLEVLSERLGPVESEQLLKVAGRGLVEGGAAASDGARARLEGAVEVLNELEEREGDVVIRGYSCPLAAVTPDHPEVCRMIEALIAELAEVPVREHCDRGESPRCCFEVARSHDARNPG